MSSKAQAWAERIEGAAQVLNSLAPEAVQLLQESGHPGIATAARFIAAMLGPGSEELVQLLRDHHDQLGGEPGGEPDEPPPPSNPEVPPEA